MIAVSSLATSADSNQKVQKLSTIGGQTVAVAVQGAYAYVGEGVFLTIKNISDPTLPVEVSRLELPNLVNAIALDGAIACVALNNHTNVGTVGLALVDVSDPAMPVLRTIVSVGSASDVKVIGHVAIVATAGDVYAVDITNPLSPVKHSPFPRPPVGTYPNAIAVSGSTVFVANFAGGEGNGGFFVYDVSNLSSPALLSLTPGRPSPNGNEGCYGLDVQGSLLCLSDNGYLQVYDVSDPAHPAKMGAFSGGGGSTFRHVTMRGSFAYVGDADGGLKIIDVSNPAQPALAGVIPDGSVYRVALGDQSLIYLACRACGLRIVDVENPAAPMLVGSSITVGCPTSVAERFPYVFTANGSDGIRVVKVADPERPELVGSFNTPGLACGVASVNKHLFVADYSNFTVFDISQPRQPILLSTIPLPPTSPWGDAYAVKIVGNLAYVAGGELNIFDISDPAQPVHLSSLKLLQSSMAIDLLTESTNSDRATYAYFALFNMGVEVVDVSDPAAPASVRLIPGENIYTNFMGLSVWQSQSGPRLIVNQYGIKEQIYSLDDPANPAFVSEYSLGGNPEGVMVSKDFAYVSCGTGGLRILDVSNPSAPVGCGFHGTLGETYNLAVHGSMAFVTDSIGGLVLYRLSGARINDAEILRHTIPELIPAGETITAQITVRNYGQTTWNQLQQVVLDALNDSNGFFERPMVIKNPEVDHVILEGDYTFDVEISAPSHEGQYSFYLQMRQLSGSSGTNTQEAFQATDLNAATAAYFGQDYPVWIEVTGNVATARNWSHYK